MIQRNDNREISPPNWDPVRSIFLTPWISSIAEIWFCKEYKTSKYYHTLGHSRVPTSELVPPFYPNSQQMLWTWEPESLKSLLLPTCHPLPHTQLSALHTSAAASSRHTFLMMFCNSLATSTYYKLPISFLRQSPASVKVLAITSNQWIEQQRVFFSFKRKIYPGRKACVVTLKSYVPTAEDKPPTQVQRIKTNSYALYQRRFLFQVGLFV